MILPIEPNTSSSSSKLTSIWLSPDEWMIISNDKMEKDIKWFYWGTTSLVVFNSRICFVAEAIIIKIKMQR